MTYEDLKKYKIIKKRIIKNDIGVFYSYEKHIEFIEIISDNFNIYLRHFVHICSSESNGRPSTIIEDFLYKIKDISDIDLDIENLDLSIYMKQFGLLYSERYKEEPIVLTKIYFDGVFDANYLLN